jgi:diketogulonate reductase-like aldo/keto reductase
MIFKETLTMANGVVIPQLALGTWLIDDDKAAEAVRNAVEIGYRHIDTAQAYGNERGVGEGVRTCGIKREEIFVTSKVAAEHKDYKTAAAGIDETLRKMGLEYLDMMIIHSPQPWREVNQSDNRYVEGNREAWRALEDAYKAGKLRAIGVSNFLQGDIESLCEAAEIKPMVNQILAHISNTPFDLIIVNVINNSTLTN